MKVETVAIGTELLMGQIANTNAQFIAKELNEMNMDHYYQTVVGDNPQRMKEVISQAGQRSDVVLVLGGLGPTADDISKSIIAEIVDQPLVTSKEGLAKIQAYYDKQGLILTDASRKMADTFENGESFPNTEGQAVGTAISHAGTTYIALPGPPRELKAMFTNEVRPYLLRLKNDTQILTSRYLNFHTIGESRLSAILSDLIEDQENPTLAIYINPDLHTLTVRLTAATETKKEAQDLLDGLTEEILSRTGDYYLGEGLDYSPQEALKDALVSTGESIAFAESLTGGLAASKLVDLSGASQVFKGSIVAYDARAKVEVLGVPQEIIDNYGMVSRSCAQAMAEACLDHFDSDWAISYTGVAGPDKMEGHPAGRVFVGISHRGGPSQVLELDLSGHRGTIRQSAVYQSYFALINEIKSIEED